MIFKIYDSDFGFTYNGVNYDFTNVDDITIEDPETTNLVRGANAADEIGIEFTEGSKEPKTFTVTVVALSKDLFELLKQAYKNKDRLEPYCISRTDGSSKIAKNAVLSQEPRQMSINETPDSMNVSLAFKSFKIDTKHKS